LGKMGEDIEVAANSKEKGLIKEKLQQMEQYLNTFEIKYIEP